MERFVLITFVRAIPFCILLAALMTRAQTKPFGLTFYGWSDQHIQTNGDGSHLEPAIDAMNAMPGRSYPTKYGGKVAKPAFVLGAGDITEWPTFAAMTTYERLITKRLQYPSCEIAGNHDSGGLSPSDTMYKWLKQRHSGLSYVFVKGGVKFIMVHSEFDASGPPAQAITHDALAYLRRQLALTPKNEPVVPVMHLCLDAITNKDDLVEAFGHSNILFVVGGHYHKATVNEYRGFKFVQLPSPAPNGDKEVTVIRITPTSILAIPFDYAKQAWTEDERKILYVTAVAKITR